MDMYDDIYYSLLGQRTAEAALGWVPNAFAPGSVCDEAYSRLIGARNRIADRLGVEGDQDLEQMLDEMETIQYVLCRTLMELRLP